MIYISASQEPFEIWKEGGNSLASIFTHCTCLCAVISFFCKRWKWRKKFLSSLFKGAFFVYQHLFLPSVYTNHCSESAKKGNFFFLSTNFHTDSYKAYREPKNAKSEREETSAVILFSLFSSFTTRNGPRNGINVVRYQKWERKKEDIMEFFLFLVHFLFFYSWAVCVNYITLRCRLMSWKANNRASISGEAG